MGLRPRQILSGAVTDTHNQPQSIAQTVGQRPRVLNISHYQLQGRLLSLIDCQSQPAAQPLQFFLSTLQVAYLDKIVLTRIFHQ